MYILYFIILFILVCSFTGLAFMWNDPSVNIMILFNIVIIKAILVIIYFFRYSQYW